MKIKIDVLKYFILILPFFEPLLFKEVGFEMIDNIYSILKIISFLYVSCIYLYRKKYNTLFINILVLEIIIFISTIIHNGDVIKFIGPCVSILCMTMLTDYYFKKMKNTFLKINYFILYCLMIINLVTIISNPYGI